jgi:hypothetical protein
VRDQIAGVLVFLVLFSGCALRPNESSAELSPRVINRAAEYYDGKTLEVTGLLESRYPVYSLWTDKASKSRGDYSRDCISLLVPVDMDSDVSDGRIVTIRGRFLKNPARAMVTSGGCNTSTIVLGQSDPIINVE